MAAPYDASNKTQVINDKILMSCWLAWAMALCAPVIWLVYVLINLPMAVSQPQAAATSGIGRLLFGLSVAWLALAGPVAFILRSHCFRATWDGRTVEPTSYYRGLTTIWAVLVLGAAATLYSSLLVGQAMPGGIVAIIAIALIGASKPNAKAVTG